ncbi:hypothetical protein G7Z17_g7243 [Cylindrodendrum hubeiense]|uniref:Uncharacterized protein n=1 Tax=Cylindrodendrum hubeiense TaxID=595255 RepID=A0A9P5H413_9HYPO|nr:hypothetical protein G7Z17_g7243 [Cylindrodendrum hubeiense]
MALGQFEFTLLASVLVAYIIFTPEPLVLLRNLAAWATLTWMAWYGHQHWETSAWTRRLVSGFYNDRAISTIVELYWDEALGVLYDLRAKSIGGFPLKWLANIFGWLRPDGRTSGTKTESDRAVPRHKKYYAILITTPPVHFYGPFRRHFALCLVPTGVWESKTKTLAEKFDGQLFWDYYGDIPGSSRAAAWPRSRISTLNGIQELGIIRSDGDAVSACTSQNWKYLNIWWNDADFAIILACLVDESAVPICRVLMRRRDELRETEITMPRQASCRAATFMTLAAAGGLMVMTAGLAAPVAAPLFAAAGATHFAKDVLTAGENDRRDQRLASSNELQDRFPHLRQLFM